MTPQHRPTPLAHPLPPLDPSPGPKLFSTKGRGGMEFSIKILFFNPSLIKTGMIQILSTYFIVDYICWIYIHAPFPFHPLAFTMVFAVLVAAGLVVAGYEAENSMCSTVS